MAPSQPETDDSGLPMLALADQRSAEIVDSARRVFAEKGFDGASMQDIARQAGMSVGNFYRYFPSKFAIVEALVGADVAKIEADFADALDQPDPIAALRDLARRRVEDGACLQDGQIWGEISACALRRPEISAITALGEARILAAITGMLARLTGIEAAEANARWLGHGQLMILLIKGASIRPPGLLGSAALNEQVLRIIDQILNEILTSVARKG